MAAVRLKRDEVCDLIAKAPIFSHASKSDLRHIAAIADVVDLPAGKALTREGEIGREFAVIVSGCVEVRRHGRKLRMLGSGDWLGEIALLTGAPRTATATTKEPTRVILIRGGMFRGLLERSPRLAYRVLERVAGLVPGSD